MSLSNLLHSTFNFVMRPEPFLSIVSLQIKMSVLVEHPALHDRNYQSLEPCAKVFIAATQANMRPIVLADQGLMEPCKAAASGIRHESVSSSWCLPK